MYVFGVTKGHHSLSSEKEVIFRGIFVLKAHYLLDEACTPRPSRDSSKLIAKSRQCESLDLASENF